MLRVSVKLLGGAGYRGFGSFHTERVTDLLARYADPHPPAPPELPFQSSVFDDDDGVFSTFSINSPLAERKSFFLLKPESLYLNHGAFGAPLAAAVTRSAEWRDFVETDPVAFFDRVMLPYCVYAFASIAPLALGSAVDLHDCTLAANATSALNAVVKAAGLLRTGDTVLTLSTTYGALKTLLRVHCEAVAARLVVVDVGGGRDDSSVLRCVEAAMDSAALARNDVRLLVLDHVTSNTATILPIKALHALVSPQFTLIDGAHATATLPVPLTVSDLLFADFYVTNLHKFFLAPRGSALLWVNPTVRKRVVEGAASGCDGGICSLDTAKTAARRSAFQHGIVDVRNCIVSHGYGDGLLSSFVYDGNRDYSAWMSLPVVANFWADAPRRHAVLRHNITVAREIACHVATQLGTELWRPLQELAMCLARLPVDCAALEAQGLAPSAVAVALQDSLYYNHSIELPVKYVDDGLWVRISGSPYCDVSDGESLVVALKSVLRALEKGQLRNVM